MSDHEQEANITHAHPDVLPAPTAAPIVFAFGTTLGFAGLVTNPWVSVVGVTCAVFGIIAWWRAVLPVEATEPIPQDAYRETQTGAGPNAPIPAHAKDAPARRVVPGEIPRVRSGILGGIAGGAAMAGVALLWGAIYHTIWMPINLLAGLVLSSVDPSNLSALESFDGGAFAAALGIHAAFSIGMGLLLAAMMPIAARWPKLFSCLVAPAIWSLLAWVTMDVVDPALGEWVNWWWFIASQFAFGCVAGFVIARSEKIELVQFLSPAERLGLERSRGGGDQ